jgi:hypothetical protein
MIGGKVLVMRPVVGWNRSSKPCSSVVVPARGNPGEKTGVETQPDDDDRCDHCRANAASHALADAKGTLHRDATHLPAGQVPATSQPRRHR